jgi:hypothetical protein
VHRYIILLGSGRQREGVVLEVGHLRAVDLSLVGMLHFSPLRQRSRRYIAPLGHWYAPS